MLVLIQKDPNKYINPDDIVFASEREPSSSGNSVVWLRGMDEGFNVSIDTFRSIVNLHNERSARWENE